MKGREGEREEKRDKDGGRWGRKLRGVAERDGGKEREEGEKRERVEEVGEWMEDGRDCVRGVQKSEISEEH